MNHEQAAAELSAYLDGELHPTAKSALEAHLSGCAECRAHLDELRGSVALFKQQARRAAPPLLASNVLAAAREASGSRGRSWKPVLAYSIAAVCGVFIGITAMKKALPGSMPAHGMLSGAAMGLSEEARSPAAAGGWVQLAPASAPAASEGAGSIALEAARGAAVNERGFSGQSRAAAGLSRAASFGDAGASALSGGGVFKGPALEAGPQPSPRQELFEDAAAFAARWKNLTTLPPPQVDFSVSKILLLTGAPKGRRWTVVSARSEAGASIVTFVSEPAEAQASSGPPEAPAFAVVPRSDTSIQLQPAR